jgi:hypothetical protein
VLDHVNRRRAIVAAAVSLLVMLDIVLWLRLFDPHSGDNSASSGRSPAAGLQTTASSTPGHTATGSQVPAGPSEATPSSVVPIRDEQLTLRLARPAAGPWETVRISGRYRGAATGTELRVQLQRGRQWVNFPLPTVVRPSDGYKTYVELGGLGRNRLRVVDPATGGLSNVVTLHIQ